MNKKLLHPEVQSFIKSFKANLSDFLLRKPQFRGVTNQEIATQIQAVRIARVKIPEFSKRDDIIYPAKLHLEQSSSFLTSQFKANLLYGMKGVDLTGGFGIDTYFLGKTNYEVIYTEPNRELAAIVATNFKNLNADTIKVLDLSAELMLDQLSMQLDWFYIDPSRRNDQNTKIITFEKSQPDVINLQSKLKKKFHRGLIKASPMLSITKAINQLNHVIAVNILALKDEVKELLFEIDYNKKRHHPKIKCYDLALSQPLLFSADYEQENNVITDFNSVKNYLYIPHSTILKAGFFNKVSIDYDVNKIAEHTHVYTSTRQIDFPGRCFKVKKVLAYKPKFIKKYYAGKDFHVIKKNFGISAENIRLKFKLNPRGNHYLIAFKDNNGDRIIADTELVTDLY